MKKSYSIALASSVAIIALSSFTIGENDKRKPFSVLLGPYLPDEVYDYRIQFPAYIIEQVFWVEQNETAVENAISNEKATLGRVLFYDKLLSQDFSTSCSSCHEQAHGFADNRRLSKGIGGQSASRNTPNINDLAWRMSYWPLNMPFFWDAREDNFHEMVTTPIMAPNEMGLSELEIVPRLEASSYYPALFEAAYGEPGIDLAKTREALVQFIKSMTTFDSKYDKVKNGEASFTAVEAAGEALFIQHCNTCHTSPHFGILTPLENGFPSNGDAGLGGVTNLGTDFGKFKSPSLRNVALTAPYMHDGKFVDMPSVLKFYADSISSPNLYYNPSGEALILAAISLNESEIVEMTAFLSTLTSSDLSTHPKWSDPFVLPAATHSFVGNAAVKIYPNPASSVINIEIEGMEGQQFDLEIYGQNGQLLRSVKLNSKSEKLDKGDLLPGVYLLKIKGKTQTVAHQLVIQ